LKKKNIQEDIDQLGDKKAQSWIHISIKKANVVQIVMRL